MEQYSGIKKHRKSKFTQVSNTLVGEQGLTLKAKGLFIYLWSKPDNWQYNRADILKHCKDGKDAVLSGIKELETLGYLVREEKFKKGLKDGYIYHLSDEPDFLKEDMKKTIIPTVEGFTVADNPPSSTVEGFTVADNPPYSNTNLTKTNVADVSARKILEGDREGALLSAKLIANILSFKKDFKTEGKEEKWATEFALAIRRDNRTYSQMNSILTWMASGGRSADFWKTVVLSGKKFRQQVDQLEINMKKDGFAIENNGVTKKSLKEYLINTFGKSKYFMSFTVDGKKKMVAFSGEHNTMANFNTGEFLSKEQSDWVWTHMLKNHKELFPKFKG